MQLTPPETKKTIRSPYYPSALYYTLLTIGGDAKPGLSEVLVKGTTALSLLGELVKIVADSIGAML